MPQYKSSELRDIAGSIAEKELQIAVLGLKKAEVEREKEKLETLLDSKTYRVHIFYEFEVEHQTHDKGKREWINRFWYGKDFLCETHKGFLETEEKADQLLRIVEKQVKRFVGREVHSVLNYSDPPYKEPNFPLISRVLEYHIPFAWFEHDGKNTFLRYVQGQAWEFGMLKGLFGFPGVPPPGAEAFEIRPKYAYSFAQD